MAANSSRLDAREITQLYPQDPPPLTGQTSAAPLAAVTLHLIGGLS
jgi:hypothetical protein